MQSRRKKRRYKGVHVVTTGIAIRKSNDVSNLSPFYFVIAMKKLDLLS